MNKVNSSKLWKIIQEAGDHLKDQLPEIKNGLFDAYKEIIPALKKQRDEPQYHLDISLPENQAS